VGGGRSIAAPEPLRKLAALELIAALAPALIVALALELVALREWSLPLPPPPRGMLLPETMAGGT
jgi:hypothetical protein